MEVTIFWDSKAMIRALLSPLVTSRLVKEIKLNPDPAGPNEPDQADLGALKWRGRKRHTGWEE